MLDGCVYFGEFRGCLLVFVLFGVGCLGREDWVCVVVIGSNFVCSVFGWVNVCV